MRLFNYSFGFLVFSVFLSGCESLVKNANDFERDSKRKHELDLRESELHYAEELCSASPLVGQVSGFNLALQLKRQELNEAKAALRVETYTRLSQELVGYTTEWEVLNQQAKAACHQHAVCLARNSDSGICRDADNKYQAKLQAGNDLVLKVQQLKIHSTEEAVRE